jgi:glucokinase
MTVLAFDIGGTRVKAAVVEDGRVVPPVATIQSSCGETGEDLLERVVALGRRLVSSRPAQAVALSVRGVVDAERRVVVDVNPPLAALIGKPLGDLLAGELRVPATMDNDARMHALGEWCYGHAAGVDNLVCVTLGTGVGSGVVSGGRLLRGRRGVGGILSGHFTVDLDGPRCGCGNVGCLEALIGAEAFTARTAVALRAGARSSLEPTGLSPEAIFAAARAGDPVAEGAVSRFTRILGAGLVTMVHAYDPDVIVIGGGLTGSADCFVEMLRTYVDEHAWTRPRGRVRIEVSKLGPEAALLGAAALATQTIVTW